MVNIRKFSSGIKLPTIGWCNLVRAMPVCWDDGDAKAMSSLSAKLLVIPSWLDSGRIMNPSLNDVSVKRVIVAKY